MESFREKTNFIELECLCLYNVSIVNLDMHYFTYFGVFSVINHFNTFEVFF